MTVKFLANVHQAGHHLIGDPDKFKWHSGADQLHSSQAFCLSFWGAAARPEGQTIRSSLVALTAEPAFLEMVGKTRAEYFDRQILGETGLGEPTNVDVLIETDDLVIAVESKLTESLAGCRQASTGACTGRYEVGSDTKTQTDSPCRLSVPDGQRGARRYWQVMNELCRRGVLDPPMPCPFRGGGYQAMRNIAFAAEKARRAHKDWRTVFAYPVAQDHGTDDILASIWSLLAPEAATRVIRLDYGRVVETIDDQSLQKYLQQRLVTGQMSDWKKH